MPGLQRRLSNRAVQRSSRTRNWRYYQDIAASSEHVVYLLLFYTQIPSEAARTRRSAFSVMLHSLATEAYGTTIPKSTMSERLRCGHCYGVSSFQYYTGFLLGETLGMLSTTRHWDIWRMGVSRSGADSASYNILCQVSWRGRTCYPC